MGPAGVQLHPVHGDRLDDYVLSGSLRTGVRLLGLLQVEQGDFLHLHRDVLHREAPPACPHDHSSHLARRIL